MGEYMVLQKAVRVSNGMHIHCTAARSRGSFENQHKMIGAWRPGFDRGRSPGVRFNAAAAA